MRVFDLASLLFSHQQVAEGEAARLYDPMIGVVTSITDPERLCRVRVRLPTLSASDDTWWATVVSPGAGADRGWFTLPEIGDEVLVVFEHGDLSRPVVIGALWNGRDVAPDENDGANERRTIVSKSGHRIILDDAERTVTISDGAGIGSVIIAESGVTLQATSGDVAIQAHDELTMVAAEIEIKGSVVGLYCKSSKVNATGTGGVSIKGNVVNLKGSTMDINPGGVESAAKADGTVSGQGEDAGSNGAVSAGEGAAAGAVADGEGADGEGTDGATDELVSDDGENVDVNPGGPVGDGIRGAGPAGLGDRPPVDDAVPSDEEEPDKTAYVIELDDTFFRTDSAVLCPEGEQPRVDGDGKHVTAVGVIASTLRRVADHPAQTLLIVGHTDTVGSPDYNQKLSQLRAETVTSALSGDRAAFVAHCHQRHTVADYQQILAWAASTRDWPCDPGKIDGKHGPMTSNAVRAFRTAFRAAHGGNLADSSHVDPPLWGAFFDCYDETIADELGVDASGLATLRAGLKFVGASPIGCGEHHPIDGAGLDNYRSIANRRVELVMFDPGEEPSLPCHGGGGCQPGGCDLYDPKKYKHVAQPVMLSAKPWTAAWDRETVGVDARGELIVTTPGMRDGTPVELVITEIGHGEVARLAAETSGGEVRAWFEQFWDDNREPARVELAAGAEFPVAKFQFVATGADRTATSGELTYVDSIEGIVLDPFDEPRRNTPYTIYSPWGTRDGVTDGDGKIDEPRLPPGGAAIICAGTAHLRKS